MKHFEPFTRNDFSKAILHMVGRTKFTQDDVQAFIVTLEQYEAQRAICDNSVICKKGSVEIVFGRAIPILPSTGMTVDDITVVDRKGVFHWWVRKNETSSVRETSYRIEKTVHAMGLSNRRSSMIEENTSHIEEAMGKRLAAGWKVVTSFVVQGTAYDELVIWWSREES